MSTYYYAVCDQHRVVSGVLAGRSFPGRWWDDDENSLAEFLAEHARCIPSLRLVSENDSAADDYAEFKRREEGS